MTETPFLIAHKVRGEAAFDVAIKIDIGGEEGWIIPTSGHRAYPYWSAPLENLFPVERMPELPADLRDHYTINKPKESKKLSLEELGISLEDLGL